jgi:hypothetical protein
MSVITEGRLQGAIRGFHGTDTQFAFTNGQVWQQAEYKYRYAYMPRAQVLDGPRGKVLQIGGIKDTVRVRRVR